MDDVVAALRERGVTVLMDTDDILPTEEWHTRLKQLMQEADTIVVALSPNSIASEVCSWELEYSASLHKRMAPFVLEPVDARSVPSLLSRLNFIFGTPDVPLVHAVEQLLVALRSDIQWIREHTRLHTLATRWQEKGAPVHLLLRGRDVADAEAWHEGRPENAPEVTPLQARFIGESRRRSLRIQRGWLLASASVAATTAALALFAWIQTGEANSQRQRAEENARIAEEAMQVAQANADLAEAERSEAIAQRALASQRLISQSLRSGNFIEAAWNMLRFQPDSMQLDTLLSVLEAPSDIGPSNEEGQPIRVNGDLFVRAGARGVLPLRTSFPARYWFEFPDGFALVSSSGAIQRFDRNGTLLEQSPPVAPFEPCFAFSEPDSITLVGGHAFGYSAGSLALRMIRVPLDGGPMVLTTIRAFSNEFLPLGDDDTGGILADDLMSDCLIPESLAEIRAQSQRLGDPQVPMLPIEEVAFPALRPQGEIWAGPDDPVAIGIAQAERRRGYSVPGSPRYEALFDFEGRAIPGYVLMDDLSDTRMLAFRTLVDTGGTGGETHDLCVADPDGAGGCFRFWTTSGYEGIARDWQSGRIAIFGSALSGWEFGAVESGLWLVDQPGATPRPIEGVVPFGHVLDLDFGPEGEIAALTSSGLILFHAEGHQTGQVATPPDAQAVRWLSDGRILLLESGRLHIGRAESEFTSIAVSSERPAPEEVEQRALWLALDDGETTLALGFGSSVTLFDLAYLAPIMPTGFIPHPRLEDGPSGVRLDRRDDGGFSLTIAGAIYETRGYDGTDPDLYFDPEAIFR